MKGKGHVQGKNSQKESGSHVPRKGIVRNESQVLKKKEQKEKKRKKEKEGNCKRAES